MQLQETKAIGLGAAVAAGALSLPLLGQIDKATQGKYLYLAGGGAVAFGLGLGYFGRHPVFQGLGYALAAIGGYTLVADYQAASAAKASTASGLVGAFGRQLPRMQIQQPQRAAMPGVPRQGSPAGGSMNPAQPPPPQGRGSPEFPPTTPGTGEGVPLGWKFPAGTPNQPDQPPSEASQITVTPAPLPTRPARIHQPSEYAYCYASPEGGGKSVPISEGIAVTIVGYPKMIAGAMSYFITWYGGSGWIDGNCLGPP